MKKHMAVAMVMAVAILGLTPTLTSAGMSLISAPLPGGGVRQICGCTNLTDNTIEVHIAVTDSDGVWSGDSYISISPGLYGGYEDSRGVLPGICLVGRSDGKSTSTKQLACSFSQFNASGMLQVTLPVDKKIRKPTQTQ